MEFLFLYRILFLYLIKTNKMENLISRITINPEICHGKPTVRNMRWPVEVILDMLGSGMETSEILDDHPELEREDILASLYYAKLSISGDILKEVS
jgi:uncharacterized protein (DUF433 family)